MKPASTVGMARPEPVSSSRTGGAPARSRGPLAIVETHPVQYHAPVYRAVAEKFGIPVKTIYGSDFSVRGYFDREFGSSFAWDVDLIGGVETQFLARTSEGGAASFEEVSSEAIGPRSIWPPSGKRSGGGCRCSSARKRPTTRERETR
jgi:hypothetical protein